MTDGAGLIVKLGRVLVLAPLAVLMSCGGASNSPATVDESITEPTSEAPTEADFHADWCDAILGFSRVIDDLPTLDPDARTVRGFDDAVRKLDDLSTAPLRYKR